MCVVYVRFGCAVICPNEVTLVNYSHCIVCVDVVLLFCDAHGSAQVNMSGGSIMDRKITLNFGSLYFISGCKSRLSGGKSAEVIAIFLTCI